MTVKANDWKTRDRVKAHPGTDAFMKGDIYGTVERVGRSMVYVRMDRSGRLLRFYPYNLLMA